MLKNKECLRHDSNNLARNIPPKHFNIFSVYKQFLFILILCVSHALCTEVAQASDEKKNGVESAPAKAERVLFRDDFENVAQIHDLLRADSSRWTYLQRSHNENHIDLDRTHFHHGSTSLSLSSEPSSGQVSKAAIQKEGLDLREGQVVYMSASFYIPSGSSIENVFLWDLECGNCWSQTNAQPNKSPGIRLGLFNSQGYPTVERGKIGYRTGNFKQNVNQPVFIPRDKWVQLAWIVHLAANEGGLTEVFLDGTKIISEYGVNMPQPEYFMKHFGVHLNTPVHYDRIQVGITANGSRNPVKIYVDDVELRLLEEPNPPLHVPQ